MQSLTQATRLHPLQALCQQGTRPHSGRPWGHLLTAPVRVGTQLPHRVGSRVQVGMSPELLLPGGGGPACGTAGGPWGGGQSRLTLPLVGVDRPWRASEVSLRPVRAPQVLAAFACLRAWLAASSSPECSVHSAQCSPVVRHSARGPAPGFPCPHPHSPLPSYKQAPLPPCDSVSLAVQRDSTGPHLVGCRAVSRLHANSQRLAQGPALGGRRCVDVTHIGTSPTGAGPRVCRAVVLPALPASRPCLEMTTQTPCVRPEPASASHRALLAGPAAWGSQPPWTRPQTAAGGSAPGPGTRSTAPRGPHREPPERRDASWIVAVRVSASAPWTLLGATCLPAGALREAGRLWPRVRGVGTPRLPGLGPRLRLTLLPGRPALVPGLRPTDARGGRGCTHRPGGRLGCAGLLEGDVEVVGAGVVGVGGDDGRGRHGVEGGAGLRVGRVAGHAGRVLRGVGAGRGRPGAHLVHGAAQQIELGLAGSGRREGRHTVSPEIGSRPVPSGRCPVTAALKGQRLRHPTRFRGPPHPDRSLLVWG